jgi:hypothetical protein
MSVRIIGTAEGYQRVVINKRRILKGASFKVYKVKVTKRGFLIQTGNYYYVFKLKLSINRKKNAIL